MNSESFFLGLPLLLLGGDIGGGVSSTEHIFRFFLFKSHMSSGDVVDTLTETLFLIDRVVVIDG